MAAALAQRQAKEEAEARAREEEEAAEAQKELARADARAAARAERAERERAEAEAAREAERSAAEEAAAHEAAAQAERRRRANVAKARRERGLPAGSSMHRVKYGSSHGEVHAPWMPPLPGDGVLMRDFPAPMYAAWAVVTAGRWTGSLSCVTFPSRLYHAPPSEAAAAALPAAVGRAGAEAFRPARASKPTAVARPATAPAPSLRSLPRPRLPPPPLLLPPLRRRPRPPRRLLKEDQCLPLRAISVARALPVVTSEESSRPPRRRLRRRAPVDGEVPPDYMSFVAMSPTADGTPSVDGAGGRRAHAAPRGRTPRDQLLVITRLRPR